MFHHGCFQCGAIVTHYCLRGDWQVCPPCAKKLDDLAEKMVEDIRKEANKPKVMKQQCTCCPVHGPHKA